MPHRVPPEPDAEHLLRAYRWMLTARRIDDVGVAYANRQLGTHAVVWIGFGDGGAQKGEVHEATNFAAIHRLAVVFGVANNLYTQSVPLRLESSVESLATRAAGYGMPGVSVDGMDLLSVYRFMPNTSNDDDTRYRSRQEVEQWRARGRFRSGGVGGSGTEGGARQCAAPHLGRPRRHGAGVAQRDLTGLSSS